MEFRSVRKASTSELEPLSDAMMSQYLAIFLVYSETMNPFAAQIRMPL